MTENEIGTKVLEAAITVHRDLGPGLLEIVYEVTLARELSDLGLTVERQIPVAIRHKAITFDEGLRADLVVGGKVLPELKSVERVLPAHKKQVQTYLKLTGLKLGYLLNFEAATLKQGITRCVNGLEEDSSSASPRLPSVASRGGRASAGETPTWNSEEAFLPGQAVRFYSSSMDLSPL